MKAIFKKVLSSTLAAAMLFGTAQLGANSDFTIKASAEENTSYTFDEESGTLTMLNDVLDWDNEEALELIAKAKTVYIGKDIKNTDVFFTNNVTGFEIDPENENFCIYDKALYTSDKSRMVAYPCGSDDVDIVLPKECTEISEYCFKDWKHYCEFGESITGLALPVRNDYSLYITDKNQAEALSDYLVASIIYPFSNIYLDKTQTEIDEWQYDDFSAVDFYRSAAGYMLITYLSHRYDSEKMDIIETESSTLFEYGMPFTKEECETYKELLQNMDCWDYTEPTADEFYERYSTDNFEEEFKLWTDCLKRAHDYATETFENYDVFKPISEYNGGICGDNAEWKYDSTTNTLKISGSGSVKDNYSGWDLFRDSITSVEFGNGITSIGANAFEGCSSISDVYIAADNLSLGENAFGTAKPNFIAKDGTTACRAIENAGYNVIRYSLDRTFAEKKKSEEKPVLAFLDAVASENGLNCRYFTKLILDNPEAAYVYFESVNLNDLTGDGIVIDTESKTDCCEQIYFRVEAQDTDGDGQADTVKLSDVEAEKTFVEKVKGFFEKVVEFFSNVFNSIGGFFKNLFN